VTAAVGALGPKVRPPGRHADPAEARLARAAGWALVGAYAWLAVAGLLLVAEGLAAWLAWAPPPEDAARHALGAGFALLLIVGMALRLLPGFAGARGRRVALPPALLAITSAQLAALLRVGPVVLTWLVAPLGPAGLAGLSAATAAVLALSGLLGVVAVAGLWVALRASLSARP
jgi:uncharacterized protein involved in response to NO